MRQTIALNRRAFCQAAGASILLPRLEAFADLSDPRPPLRFVTLFFPNGVYPDAWQARQNAQGLKLAGSLAPLSELSSKAIVIQGLDNPLGGHIGQTSGFLSGHDFAPDEDGVIRARASLDQMLAQQFSDETFVPSLNLAVEPPSQGGFGNRPRSFGNSISWSSPTNKVEPQINPQQAFDAVFFGQTQAGRSAARRRQTIVNEIWHQARQLGPKISHHDRHRLDQYLDSVHDLQAKLQKAIQPQSGAWKPQSRPPLARPKSSATPSNHEDHMRLMLDIMLLALQTNSTRVATLVMGHSISRVVFDFADSNITRNHHDLSHHRNDPQKVEHYNIVTHWFSKQAAYLLGRMDQIDEGNGSLLDNSVVIYGSGMKDGNVHEPKNVPVALFGGGGSALRTGRLLSCPEDSLLAQLHLSLLDVFGVEADNFNGVTSQRVGGLI